MSACPPYAAQCSGSHLLKSCASATKLSASVAGRQREYRVPILGSHLLAATPSRQRVVSESSTSVYGALASAVSALVPFRLPKTYVYPELQTDTRCNPSCKSTKRWCGPDPKLSPTIVFQLEARFIRACTNPQHERAGPDPKLSRTRTLVCESLLVNTVYLRKHV